MYSNITLVKPKLYKLRIFMKSVLDYFKMITAIPRCSYKADKMKDKIISIAEDFGFSVDVDKAGNVLCKKGNPRVCLQAHYDMVCLGDTDNIELIQEGNILKTKNSTLGADNGMGMAIMFSIMEKLDDIECLFTSDEEVGLIGATNLELELSSNKLLNLDSEEESEIYVGCAGGVDIVSKLDLEYLPLGDKEVIYEVSISDLVGGHSGIDIDKGIDSAIKVLAKELVKHDLKLLHVEGGEVRNSISKKAKAIVATCKDLKLTNKALHVEVVEYKREYIKNGEKIIKVLNAFSQGVRGFDKSFDIPSTSVNLGLVNVDDGVLKIDCAARAMRSDDLADVAEETKSMFELIGCEVSNSDGHEPWVPDIGDFAKLVKSKMQKRYDNVDFRAIHAGLECGVLIQSQSKNIEAVAIGPTIRYPHSLREECELDSVERIRELVEEIIEGA